MEEYNVFDREIINNELDNKIMNKVFIKVYESIDSTNNQAKKYIKSSAFNVELFNKNKLIIFAADSQLAGRGRRGHNWLSSDPASIAVSFLFKPEANVDEIPQITAAAALAVKDTFNFFDLKTVVKWPNDILVNNKKICGILSELVLNKKEEIFVIVGCGINLNNDYFNSEIKEIATSYYLQKAKKINKNLFLARLIEKINFYFDNYLAEKRDQIINQWKETLNLTGKKVDLRHNGKKETVLIKAIMDNGDLLVEFPDGRQKKLQSSNTSLNYQSLDKYNDCSWEGEKNEF